MIETPVLIVGGGPVGLSLGIDFYPLALIVPVNPGRIGFDDL